MRSSILLAAVAPLAAMWLNNASAEDWSPLWTTATLSQARWGLSATSVGNDVFFAGGFTDSSLSNPSNVVDIYNTSTGIWSTATLSQARGSFSAASAGNQVFFAGGLTGSSDADMSNVVDIYSTSTGSWSTATLSQARESLSATSVGNQVFFAGGDTSLSLINPSNVVDIYNTSVGTWSTAHLSQAHYDLSATSAGNQVFFGGGYCNATTPPSPSNVVDMCNTSTGTWSTATLSQARGWLAATSAGNQVFFGGGDSGGFTGSNVVDIYNTSTGTWSTATLSQARFLLSATSTGNEVFFAGGTTGTSVSNVVDIYNTSTGTWSTATLSQARGWLAATSAGNQVFFGGGFAGIGYNDPSNVVDIYTLQNYPSISSTKTFTLQDNTTVTGQMQLSGGSLALSTFNLNVGSMSGNAPIDLGSQTLTVGSDNTSTTYSGIISDAGSLLKIGSGTLVLTGGNNYTGGTTISGGTLQLGNGGATGSIAGTTSLIDNGTLVVSRSDAVTDAVLWNSTAISGSGGLAQLGPGALTMTASNAYTGATTISSGTLQIGNGGSGEGLASPTIINNGCLVFSHADALTIASSISGSGNLTKIGYGSLTLSGSSNYSGSTNINQGTLNVSGAIVGGGNVLIGDGATLGGSGLVQGNIVGEPGSAILASGNLTLGDSTSYTGFNHAGTLIIGSNTVTLNSAGFANLGILTTLSGGTLAAPNGVSIGVGCNLVGSGVVNAKIAASYGSTINATGNLTLGDSTSPVGFVSDGELYTNANTVTLNSFNAANNQNAVVLGSLTEIDGGGLVAPNGILLENGNNLVATDAGGSVSGGSASRFLNRGNVQGPSSASSNWLIFNMLFKGSTGQTSGRIGFLGGFATGDSPGVNTQYGATELGGSGTEFDIGGTTPGSSDNNYGQLNIVTNPSDLNDHGDLILSPGTSFKIVDWNGFVPAPGETFTVLTWDGTLSGTASLVVDPAFAADGIQFLPQWNSNSLLLEAVPEPSSLVLLGIGVIGLMGYACRRRRNPDQIGSREVTPFNSQKGL